MGKTTSSVSCLLVLIIALPGWAANPNPTSLRDAAFPAWSLRASQYEMIVSVSPIRQTLQVFSSSAIILGAGIDAIVNEKYLKTVREVLGDYDAGAVFEERLATRLSQVLPQGVSRIAPLTSTAGYNSEYDAQSARYQGATKGGCDVLLDLKMTYGIFGYVGLLAAKIEGRLTRVADNHKLWSGAIVVSADPILANTKLKDPTKQLGSDIVHLRLTVEKDAVERWTGDGGATIRTRYETAVDGAISALLCDLGLAEEANGEYYLGIASMGRKRFSEAENHFRNAVALDPAWIEPGNARAVNLAHNNQLDDALAQCTEVTKANPDFGPAWFNLAWWYATKKHDAEAARPCYEKALELGMPNDAKIDRLLAK